MVKRESIFSPYNIPFIIGLISSIIGLIGSIVENNSGRYNDDKISTVFPVHVLIGLFLIAIIALFILIVFKIKQQRNEKQLLNACKEVGIDVIDLPNKGGEMIRHNFILDELKRKGVLEEINKPTKGYLVKDILSIDIIYTTGSPFFNYFRDILLQSARMGAIIRILIATKGSDFLSDLAALQIEGEEFARKTLDNYITDVEGIIKEINNLARNVNVVPIQLMHYRTEFRNTIVLIETRQTKIGFITLMLPPKISHNLLSFTINGNDMENEQNLYRMSKEHFNHVWNKVTQDKQDAN